MYGAFACYTCTSLNYVVGCCREIHPAYCIWGESSSWWITCGLGRLWFLGTTRSQSKKSFDRNLQPWKFLDQQYSIPLWSCWQMKEPGRLDWGKNNNHNNNNSSNNNHHNHNHNHKKTSKPSQLRYFLLHFRCWEHGETCRIARCMGENRRNGGVVWGCSLDTSYSRNAQFTGGFYGFVHQSSSQRQATRLLRCCALNRVGVLA